MTVDVDFHENVRNIDQDLFSLRNIKAINFF